MALLFPLPTHCRHPRRSIPSQIPISLALCCYTPNIGHFQFAKHSAANSFFSICCLLWCHLSLQPGGSSSTTEINALVDNSAKYMCTVFLCVIWYVLVRIYFKVVILSWVSHEGSESCVISENAIKEWFDKDRCSKLHCLFSWIIFWEYVL